MLNNLFWRIKLIFRKWYWKFFLGKFGAGSRILGRVTLFGPELIFVGENVSINEGVIMNPRKSGTITIGNNVHISSGVIINATGLIFDPKEIHKSHMEKPVAIGDGVWLCAGAIINPGVNVGKNSIIAAGAVLNDSTGEGEVWGGVPAKFIKHVTN